MLDIGALDAEVPKFWLKDHLAAYIPGSAPVSGNLSPANVGDQPVLPPEQYFKE
jgi:hypothetical protein